jgi:hypothetical protein
VIYSRKKESEYSVFKPASTSSDARVAKGTGTRLLGRKNLLINKILFLRWERKKGTKVRCR